MAFLGLSWHKRPITVLVAILLSLIQGAVTQSGRDQLLQTPFEAGVSHMNGRYGFTQDNFLIEGATQLDRWGANAIFIKLLPQYRSTYPDKSNPPMWPSTEPKTLTALIQTAPYKAMLNLPFRTIVITAYTFANSDHIEKFGIDPSAAAAEEKEFYDLTRYLYSAYAGTGKTFVLKHWEGDFHGLQGHDNKKNISTFMVDAMRVWLTARQNGVSRGRRDAGTPVGVGVFHAVEMVRILDYTQSGLTRVVNAVVPSVRPDMVTYSSYDSSLQGMDPSSTAASMNEAINAIKTFAPDPLGLGDKRILISEYGLFENERLAAQTPWRTETILRVSQASGLFGSFLWEVFDNECRDCNGNYFPVDTSTADITRPQNGQCRGLWLMRPDGSLGPLLPLIAKYWSPSTTGVNVTGKVTTTGGTSIAGAKVTFFGGSATSDINGNYTLRFVPAGEVQLTASAAGFQRNSRLITVGTSNALLNFALTSSSSPGTIGGRILSATTGLAIAGASIVFSGGTTVSNTDGVFGFASVPGGSHKITIQKSGLVSVVNTIAVQPGIKSILNAQMAAGGKLVGQVLNASGLPVIGAQVNIHGGNVNTSKTLTTDSNGAFDSGWLPTGDYRVVITASGLPRIVSPVSLSAGITLNKIFRTNAADFVLAGAPDIQTVARPLSTGFWLNFALSAGFTGTPSFKVNNPPAGTTITFGASSIPGTVHLNITTSTSTPSGTYPLTVVGTSGAISHSLALTLIVTPPLPRGIVTGKVTRASDGVGIAGAAVTCPCGGTTTDSTGTYKIPNLATGTVRVRASAPGFGDAEAGAFLRPGETETISLALPLRSGTIAGKVTSAWTGAALAGATVAFSGGSTSTDANGNYSFTSVASGTYTLTATKTGYVSNSITVLLSAGATATANIKLATGGQITGKVVNSSGTAISGAAIRFRGGMVATDKTVLTNSSGVYNSGWIAIGLYSVEASKTGFTTQTATINIGTGEIKPLNFTLK